MVDIFNDELAGFKIIEVSDFQRVQRTFKERFFCWPWKSKFYLIDNPSAPPHGEYIVFANRIMCRMSDAEKLRQFLKAQRAAK